MQDTLQQIYHSARKFFTGTLLSRISGFARDVTMAWAFGTSATVASFFVAFRLAHLFRRLLGEGALQSAFIPQYESLRHENETQALEFFTRLKLSLALFLTVLILLTMGGLRFLKDAHEVTDLTLIMLPSLLFICLYGLNSALLQCYRYYFIPSVAPVAFNLSWIVTALYLHQSPSEEAMAYLARFIIFGCFLQWLVTVPATWSLVKSIKKPLKLLSIKDLKKIGKPLLLGIVGIAATQINTALDSLFAIYADAEGPAYLWYAIRLQQLPLALFGIALSSALLPPLSRAVKAGQIIEYQTYLRNGIRTTLILMIPLTLLIFLFGNYLISIVYARGNFTVSSFSGTISCLWGYALGLTPMSLVLILAPAFYAQKDYMTPTIASALSVFINIGLNTLFVFGFGFGPASVAFATSLSSFWNAGYLGLNLFSPQRALRALR